MPMSPEIQKAYDEGCHPFHEGGGAITVAETKLKSWRYFLEVNSACNLRCPTCTKGNMPGYDHKTGYMEMELMEKILDKIASENPNAIVFTYGNSEPFLHPRLPECVAAIRRRGLHPEMSSNLNYVQRVDDLLAARPDLIIISLSGCTQEVYEKGHAGGKIDKVFANMQILAEANARANPKVKIAINYHVYKDNGHEVAQMREHAKNFGFDFFTSLARAISMENAIRYCQSKDPEATPFEVQEGRPDWNTALPFVSPTYVKTMDRVRIPPTKAREMYKDQPPTEVCPVGSGGMFTFIRYDGTTELCPCVADRRITLANYLDATPEQLIESRVGHAICKQCLKYRLNLYFHIADREKWNP
jgi:MoaA/NifB/PqqE/SkfB family radical SAM enzyme